jgi:hypothetical protein
VQSKINTGGNFMSSAIIAAIDKELVRLHKMREGLIKKEKAAKSAESGRSGAAKKSAKRRMTPAGRARIAEAQRKRWAAAKKRKRK